MVSSALPRCVRHAPRSRHHVDKYLLRRHQCARYLYILHSRLVLYVCGDVMSWCELFEVGGVYVGASYCCCDEQTFTILSLTDECLIINITLYTQLVARSYSPMAPSTHGTCLECCTLKVAAYPCSLWLAQVIAISHIYCAVVRDCYKPKYDSKVVTNTLIINSALRGFVSTKVHRSATAYVHPNTNSAVPFPLAVVVCVFSLKSGENVT